MMRVFYCDPGLRAYAGHFATYCNALVAGFRSLGFQTAVYGQRDADPVLIQKVGLTPTFRMGCYVRTSDDPMCGEIKSYLDLTRSVAEDLAGIDEIGQHDLVVCDAASAAVVGGIVQWMESRAATCPHVVVSVHDSVPMMAHAKPDGGFEARAVGLQAALYRLAGLSISQGVAKRLSFVSSYRNYVAFYGALLQRSVGLTPHSLLAVTPPRSRIGKRPVVVGFIGAQQPRKGFAIVPELVQRLLSESLPIEVLIQDSFCVMRPELERLIGMAATDSRLTVMTGAIDDAVWGATLDRCDILVAPYDQRHFVINHSGTATEAVANGIPLVVPEKTTLAALADECGAAVVPFAPTSLESVCVAIRTALDRIDELGRQAAEARSSWASANGPEQAVRGLLRHAGIQVPAGGI